MKRTGSVKKRWKKGTRKNAGKKKVKKMYIHLCFLFFSFFFWSYCFTLNDCFFDLFLFFLFCDLFLFFLYHLSLFSSSNTSQNILDSRRNRTSFLIEILSRIKLLIFKFFNDFFNLVFLIIVFFFVIKSLLCKITNESCFLECSLY